MAGVYAGHSLMDTRVLALKLTSPLSTEVEKFRALYTWVCQNLEVDYNLYLKNKRNRESTTNPAKLDAWNKNFRQHVLTKLLEKKQTVCTGYAYLLKDMAAHVGIRCETVDGYARNATTNLHELGIPNHTWVAVELGDSWYVCDPTWASGVVQVPGGNFIRTEDPGYFLADPALFVRNHYPLDSTKTFITTPFTMKEFLEGPVIGSGAFKHRIANILPATFEINLPSKILTIEFDSETLSDPSEVTLEWITPSKLQQLEAQITNKGKRWRITYHFEGSGRYRIQVRIAGKVVVGYEVVVAKN